MKITNEMLFERKNRMLNKSFSINTINSYDSDMKLFLNYFKLKTKGNTVLSEDLTIKEIEEWKTYLRETPTPRNSIYYKVKPTLSQSTIQSKIVSIKSFIKYLNYFYNDGIDYKKIETKKIKSDYIEYLTDTEFNLFMNFISDYEKYKINSLRMKLLCNI